MKTFRSILLLAAITVSFSQCKSQSGEKDMKTTDQKTATLTKEIIVDVRTTGEWEMDGHADCSVNYPLDEFDSRIDELKKYDKVILVCRSGGRAGIAQMKLQSAGFVNKIENRGSWQNISCNR